MDSLIHHFLIVAEGFNIPPASLYADRGVEGRAWCLHEIERRSETGSCSLPRPSFVNLSALPV
jgi:hypothetical protein